MSPQLEAQSNGLPLFGHRNLRVARDDYIPLLSTFPISFVVTSLYFTIRMILQAGKDLIASRLHDDTTLRFRDLRIGREVDTHDSFKEHSRLLLVLHPVSPSHVLFLMECKESSVSGATIAI